jgi:chloramphenicol-sensitive protein RarD
MNNQRRTGLLAGTAAYLVWGTLPVYWKALAVVSPLELLSWRMAGCGMIAWTMILLRRKPLNLKLLTPCAALLLLAAALLLVVNWGIYLWAVSEDRILEASLGYYMNPLISVILGVAFFAERLGRIRYAALFLALCGVVLMTLDAGTFPWVSISLALLFGLYGMAVKRLPPGLDNIEILAWICTLLSPAAAVFLVFRGFGEGIHIAGYGFTVTFLLLMAGTVTFLPLWLFGVGARRIPLSAMGFLQYITPTMMLLLGVLAYGEPFGLLRMIAFGLVAGALVLYSLTLRDS